MRKYVGWIAVGLVLVSVGVYGYLASPWQSARSSKASDTLYDSSFLKRSHPAPLRPQPKSCRKWSG
jgi:hypothetical protein